MWIHINFFRRNRKYVKEEIKDILAKYDKNITRFFFLFETNPFCFLALEVDEKVIPKMRKHYHIVSNTEDDLLGDGGLYFINIMQEVCYWVLHTDTNTKEKVLHCIANTLQMNKVNEYINDLGATMRNSSILDGVTKVAELTGMAPFEMQEQLIKELHMDWLMPEK